MTRMEMLVSWLRDAHAMEVASADLLKRYSEDVQKYPDIQAEFMSMLQSAAQKAERIKSVLATLGSETSAAKSVAGKIGSIWQSATSEFTHDQVVKHMLVTYSGTAMSLGSYISLAAAARHLNQIEVISLSESAAMACRTYLDWLEKRIPTLTTEFLDKEHEG